MRISPFKYFILIALLGLTACANTKLEERFSANPKKVILAPETDIDQSALLSFKPGDLVLEQPIGYLEAAIISSAYEAKIAGKKISIEAGRRLQATDVRLPVENSLPDTAKFFCDIEEREARAVLATFSPLAAMIASSKRTSKTRACLIDSDGNTQLDRAILIGDQTRNPVPLKIEEPIDYESALHVPLHGKSIVQLFYYGQGDSGLLVFGLKIFEEGEALKFNNNIATIPSGGFPKEARVFNAHFQIHEFDEESENLKLQILDPLPISGYSLTWSPRFN